MPLYSSAGASASAAAAAASASAAAAAAAASASAAAASAASFAAARSSAALAAATTSSLFFFAAAPAVERHRFAYLRLADGTAPLTGPGLPQRQSSQAQERVEVGRAEESCGTLQERHFAHAGVTSQESLLGALEPLNVALPLPALRTLQLYLLLADNERRTGSGGDGACKGQWPDIQRGAGCEAHGEGEQESQHERRSRPRERARGRRC